MMQDEVGTGPDEVGSGPDRADRLRVELRALRADDATAMAAVLADPELYAFTGGQPPTASDLHRRFALKEPGRSPSGSETWINCIVELHSARGEGAVSAGSVISAADHAAVGYVQATIPASGSTAEVAWVIGTRWQGRGIASAAAAQLIDLLRARGVRTVIAHIHPDHVASQRVAARLGMTGTTEFVDGEQRWTATLPQHRSRE